MESASEQSEDAHNMAIAQDEQLRQEREKIQENWPHLVPTLKKKNEVKLFYEKMSSEALVTFTCASCSSKFIIDTEH